MFLKYCSFNSIITVSFLTKEEKNVKNLAKVYFVILLTGKEEDNKLIIIKR